MGTYYCRCGMQFVKFNWPIGGQGIKIVHLVKTYVESFLLTIFVIFLLLDHQDLQGGIERRAVQ